MGNRNQLINDIHGKLKKVLQKMEILRMENEELKQTILRLTKEMNAKDAMNADLHQKLELSEQRSQDAESSLQVQAELDHCIQEIDACMEAVQQLV